MSQAAMSGQDTLVINNYTFTGLADQDFIKLTFPTDIVNVKTGKNGNSIYGLNETGRQADLEVRALIGQADDKFLNNLLVQQGLNFPGTVLMQGQYTKKVGDGLGNITSATYILSGGVFTKQLEAMSNADGNTDQSLVIYKMKFTLAPRVLT